MILNNRRSYIYIYIFKTAVIGSCFLSTKSMTIYGDNSLFKPITKEEISNLI